MEQVKGKTEHHVTARKDRVPIFQKAIYSIGGLVNSFQAAAIGAMVIVLNLGLGVNPALVGLVGFIPRIFDAITDPMTGYISDNIRTPWGRRRPIMALGALAGGLFFVLMFQLYKGHSESYYFWYFLLFQCLFFLGFTCFSIPWIALGYEMTPDYHERTRLQGASNFVAQFAWVIAPWFFKIMSNKNMFTDIVHGARTLAIFIGVFIVVGGMLPAIFNKEHFAD
ncbi:MAG: MFS transporter, partial [Candidatus Omnitrophota bacterium]